MKKIKKRGAVYGVITLMLCAAIYLNWSYVGAPEELLVAGQTDRKANETTGEAGITDGNDYFATSRLTREQARDEAVTILKETSESEMADQTAKDDAAAKISVLAENSVTEARVESLIRAKGYEDAVVMIGDDSVNVVVSPQEDGLDASDVTIIKDIVVSETGTGAGQIKIVEAS